MAQVLQPKSVIANGRVAMQETTMSAELFVKLIEELVDIKVQYHLANKIKTSPELARIVAVKRESDRHRADQIRAELIHALTAQSNAAV